MSAHGNTPLTPQLPAIQPEEVMQFVCPTGAPAVFSIARLIEHHPVIPLTLHSTCPLDDVSVDTCPGLTDRLGPVGSAPVTSFMVQ